MRTKMVLAVALLLLIGQACNTKTEKQENIESDKSELNFIFPKGEKGSEELFTGNVYNIGLVDADSVHTTAVGNVYFEPGARSNWHTHPSGQILIITDGIGYHQIEGQPIEVIKKGDVVKCPPNVRHWHGASPDVGLLQLYIIPNTEKGIVEWMQQVTDEEYKGGNHGNNNHSSRRKFIQQTAMAGAGLMLASPLQVFARTADSKKIKHSSN